MHISAHLDVDVVAVETEDQVSVLIELTRRPPRTTRPPTRPARTLQIVLDRSGSMGGAGSRALSPPCSHWWTGWTRRTTSGSSRSTAGSS